MEHEIVVADATGRDLPLVVQAGQSVTVAELRRALASALGRPETPRVYAGGRELDDEALLRALPLVTGERISLDRPLRDAAAARGPAGREVVVAGGLGAGHGVPLPDRAEVTIGRSASCDLVVADPEVSRRHAVVRAGADGGVTIADQGSRNGVGLRGVRVELSALDDDDVAQLGEIVVAARRTPPADARLAVDPAEGVVWFNRPPRIQPPQRQPEVAVPAAPDPPHGFRFPLASVFVPLLFAGVLYLVMPGARYFLVFLALSPVMAVAHVVFERRSGRHEHRAKLKEYTVQLAAVRERLTEIAAEQERLTRRALPDPPGIARIALGPNARLFERRPGDTDFGRVRLGLTDRTVDLHLTGGGADSEPLPTAHAVPLAVDLPAVGVLGIAGPRSSVLPMARAAVAQLATLHGPHDLGVVMLTGRDHAQDWEWCTWLPHLLPERADTSCRRMIACTRDQVESRIAELRKLIDERRADRDSLLRTAGVSGRRYVVVVDGAHRLRSLAGLAEVLREGSSHGVYAVCLDRSEADLPDECRASAVASSPSGTRFRIAQPEQEVMADVLADGLTAPLAEQVARALAPVRVLGARLGDHGDVPERVRFLDLAGLGADPTPEDIAAHWAAQPGGRCTTALLGIGPAGPVTVDLRRDGPHALVAGTSGAGKSELLQSLVASLALANSPDAMSFVLVDYKGGSAFAECAALPHCVGMVTDLDGHLADRALASLGAELRRRESLLAELGAKDVEDYWAKGGALPRLVIVVDEFASLVEEIPQFVTGVVGIGMRGRSLGVHVVLATQRPGGVVNAEMRANLNLRLCLRVTRAEESMDVVDVADAARISRLHPGRAYLRTGHHDLTVFQCARVGWPRLENGAEEAARDITVIPRNPVELGRAAPSTPGAAADGHDGDTDLTVLVRAIREAAARTEVRTGPSPWLPPLPEQVTLAELGPLEASSPVAAAVGLADHPLEQAQAPYALDLDRTGPVVVAGMARSGRSTVLRAIAMDLARKQSPSDVHLYALDYGNRALAPLAALPHCGACVDADEPDRVERLLDLLAGEVASRERILGGGGHGSLAEQRASGADPMPYMVLLLDRYEAFLARHQDADGGRLVEVVDGLLRRGPAVGVLTVLTTDRSGFTHRLGGAVETRLVLRQAAPDDVAVFGINPRELPGNMPPGRALVVPGLVEVQVAQLVRDEEGAAQAEALSDLAARLRSRWERIDPDRRPRRVDALPSVVSAETVAGLRDGHPAADTLFTLGVGGDHLTAVDVDLATTGHTFLVAGPACSGRSTALAAFVTSLRGREVGRLPVILVCPRASALAALASAPGVAGVATGPALADDLERLLALTPAPVAVVVDDAELVPDGPAADLLERLTRTARDEGNLVVAAGTTDELMLLQYRGWVAALRRGRCGLLLTPTSYVDGELLDVKLPRSTSGGWPAGRGLLVQRGSVQAVQATALDPSSIMDTMTGAPAGVR